MIIQRIKVKPNSSKDEILINENNEWTVKIKAKPIDGEANNYLIKFLAKEFKINQSSISIIKGTTNQFKTLSMNIENTELEKIIIKFKK